MRQIVVAIGYSSLVAAAALAQQNIEGHPLVTPYEGSDGGGEYWEYNAYDMIVGFDFDAREAITEPIEGQVTRLYYESPDERSELEIFRNYRTALDEAGFEEIWSCTGDGSCTTGSSRNAFSAANGIRAINGPNSHYAIGTLGYDGRLAYVAVATGRHGTSIDIIETAEMDTGMVAISAAALASGLDADGHVRVDGLMFAHDSDVLLPESEEALDALNTLLTDRPDLDLHVVGHTDMSGSLAYNLGLSQRRAASVIAALVEDYGIDARRLDAQGVGPLAPEATNASEVGRTQNRRVEIVVR